MGGTGSEALRISETKVVSLMYVFGGKATLEQMSAFGGMNRSYLGNLVSLLRKGGVIASICAASGNFFNSDTPTEHTGKTRVYSLQKQLLDVARSNKENERMFLMWAQTAFRKDFKNLEEFEKSMSQVRDGLAAFAKSKGFANYGRYLDSVIKRYPSGRPPIAELIPPELVEVIKA
jgi:hypothetical protein